jgi:SAM-dependent methyltransferase
MRDDGLADRVHFVVNDALEGGWPADHDTVLLSQMIHCFDERGVRRLISHAAKVLPTGGRLIIRDFLPPKVGAPTHETGLFGLNMLLNTGGGRVYSAPTVKRLLAPAFRAERLIDAGKTQVLIARRR